MHFDPDDVLYALCGSRYAIEYASDGTSVCTGACSEIIPTGCIRLGASNELDNSGAYAWRCVDCLTRDLLEEVRNLHTFTYLCPGMDHLDVHDREYVVEAMEDVLYPREDVLAVDPAVSLVSPTPEKSASKIQVQPQSSPRIPLKTYNLRTRHDRINTYESPTSQNFASDSSSDYEAYTRTTDVTGHPKSEARITRFIKHTPRKVNNKMRSHSTGRRPRARHSLPDSADELFIEPQRYQWSRSKRGKYTDETRDNLSMLKLDNNDNDNGDRRHWRTRSTTQVQMIEQDSDTANALQQTERALHRDSGHHTARDATAGETQNNSSKGGHTNSRSERMHQFISFYMHNANNALLTASTSKTNHRPHSSTPGKARTKTLPTDDSAHMQAGKRSQKTTYVTPHHEGSRTHYNTCTQSYSSGDLWQPNSTADDSEESLAPQHNTQQHTMHRHPTAAHGHRHRSRNTQQQTMHTGTKTPHNMYTGSPKRRLHKHPTTETHRATAAHAQAMGTAVNGPSGTLRTTGESLDVSQGSDNSHGADDNHATVDSRVSGFYTRQDSEQIHRGILEGNHVMGTAPTTEAVDNKPTPRARPKVKPKESANLAWDFDKMMARAEKHKLHMAKVSRRGDLDGNHNERRSTQPHRHSTLPHNRSTQPHNPVRVHAFVHTPNSSLSKPATNTVTRQLGNAETSHAHMSRTTTHTSQARNEGNSHRRKSITRNCAVDAVSRSTMQGSKRLSLSTSHQQPDNHRTYKQHSHVATDHHGNSTDAPAVSGAYGAAIGLSDDEGVIDVDMCHSHSQWQPKTGHGKQRHVTRGTTHGRSTDGYGQDNGYISEYSNDSRNACSNKPSNGNTPRHHDAHRRIPLAVDENLMGNEHDAPTQLQQQKRRWATIDHSRPHTHTHHQQGTRTHTLTPPYTQLRHSSTPGTHSHTTHPGPLAAAHHYQNNYNNNNSNNYHLNSNNNYHNNHHMGSKLEHGRHKVQQPQISANAKFLTRPSLRFRKGLFQLSALQVYWQ